MKNKESKAMTEIREIRERLSEKLKDMTLEEQVAFTKKEAEDLKKSLGLLCRAEIRFRHRPGRLSADDAPE